LDQQAYRRHTQAHSSLFEAQVEQNCHLNFSPNMPCLEKARADWLETQVPTAAAAKENGHLAQAVRSIWAQYEVMLPPPTPMQQQINAVLATAKNNMDVNKALAEKWYKV
jgi:hypothetical protein